MVFPKLLFLFLLFWAAVEAQDGTDDELPDNIPDDLPEITPAMMDGFALVMFRSTIGNPAALAGWGEGDPCNQTRSRWVGVVCAGGAVAGLRLGGMGLSGKLTGDAIDALSHLASLRSVALSDNRFSGEVPPLSSLLGLKSVFLSRNSFSGDLAADFFSGMAHLKKVWLDANSFSGEIPSSLSELPLLRELHLEGNLFSGAVHAFDSPSLSSFNVSNNKLRGRVPESLRKFGETAFQGNADLCFQGNCSAAAAAAAAAAPPEDGTEVLSWRTTIVGVVLATLFLALLSGVFIIKRRRTGVFDTLGFEDGGGPDPGPARVEPGGSGRGSESGKSGSSSTGKGSGSGSGRTAEGGALVMLDQDKPPLALPDLLKSAAELLASTAVGATYRVLLPTDDTVVVKRLRAVNGAAEPAFDGEIRRLARLRHPNLLPPIAYHFTDAERLLVFDFFDQGSLNYALHGDRGAFHVGMTWPTRLRIVQGIARGMAFLHAELAGAELPHGNLKSSNVMLGPDYEPRVADYGLAGLLDPDKAAANMAAHRAPEAAEGRQLSPKSDVFCLGVVLLEVVSGKYPSQYWSSGAGGTDVVAWAAAAVAERREAELVDPEIFSKKSMACMERLVRIGASCTDPKPDNRPTMKEAARRIDAVAADEPPAAAAAPPLKEGHAVLTSRLSARERNVDSFGIS